MTDSTTPPPADNREHSAEESKDPIGAESAEGEQLETHPGTDENLTEDEKDRADRHY